LIIDHVTILILSLNNHYTLYIFPIEKKQLVAHFCMHNLPVTDFLVNFVSLVFFSK